MNTAEDRCAVEAGESAAFVQDLAGEPFFRSIVEALPVGLYRKDKEGRFIFGNKRLSESLGQPLDQILSKTDFDFFPHEMAERYRLDEQRIKDTGDSFQDVEWRGGPNGKIRYIQVVKDAVYDRHGEIDGIQGVFWDITDRIDAEEALRTSEERFRQLAENINEVFWIIDPELKQVFYVSPAFQKIWGRTCEELYQNPRIWLESIDEEDRSKVRSSLESQSPWEMEHRIVRPDGTLCWVLTRAFPIKFESGDVFRLVGIVQDITERKRIDNERHQLEDRLRQSQKLESLGQLGAGIAHEINTPIQYVGDNMRFFKEAFESLTPLLKLQPRLLQAHAAGAMPPELLAEAETAFKGADLIYLLEQLPVAVHESLEGVDRVAMIVRAMKDFSHPGFRQKTPLNLQSAIESTITVARHEWKYVAEVITQFDPALPPVPCLASEFNQVILNLIVNAAHAITDALKEQPGTTGVITLQTRRDGDWAEIRVGDTGSGIPEAIRSKVFDPFFTTKEIGKGTGQGLAIAYASVVTRHGGTIDFETELGRGTTFIVRLPLISLPRPQPDPTA